MMMMINFVRPGRSPLLSRPRLVAITCAGCNDDDDDDEQQASL